MADYGPGSDPHEVVPLEMRYARQKAATHQAARRVRRAISDLQQVQDLPKEAKHKIDYLTVQMACYSGILQALGIQETHLEERRAQVPGVASGTDAAYMERLEQEQDAVFKKFHEEATEIFKILEDGLDRAQGMPMRWYTNAYVNAKAFFDKNPKCFYALAFGLPIGGAFAFGAYNAQYGYCAIAHALGRLGVTGVGCACEVGLAGSLFGGLVVGVAALGIVYGIQKLVQQCAPEELDNKERQHLEHLEAMVAAMKKMSTRELVEGVRSLKDFCENNFGKPVFSPPPDDVCPICLEAFDAEDIPTKPINCQGRHVMHLHCFRDFQNRNYTRCPMCNV